jgi:hypothetical protein
MHSQRSRFAASIVCAACIVSGCPPSVPEEEIEQPSRRGEAVQIERARGTAYDSVGHIWVDSLAYGHSGRRRTHTLEEAVRAARAEAARLGANGLVNTVCLDQSRGQLFGNDELAILCYGNAVRIRGSAG